MQDLINDTPNVSHTMATIILIAASRLKAFNSQDYITWVTGEKRKEVIIDVNGGGCPRGVHSAVIDDLEINDLVTMPSLIHSQILGRTIFKLR